MTEAQQKAVARIAARCSVRGVIDHTGYGVTHPDGSRTEGVVVPRGHPMGGPALVANVVQVGFESINGRDREAYIAPDGSRLSTVNTWGV